MKIKLEAKHFLRFLLVFLFLLCSIFILERTKVRTAKEYQPVMLDAAKRTEAAFLAIKNEKAARGYIVSPLDDPNHTGLVGEPYTSITTTLGSLESKRSTTNPNTSAMVVDMLYQCGVKEGDTVAVNLSSSFPCMNIAVLCALDAMKLKGVIINSVGASTYGANLPDFTYMDMEYFLLENGYVSNHSAYFSLGGQDDIGKEMPEDVKASITERISGYGCQFLHYEDLGENLAAREAIYESGASPVCLINAGGNLLSFGGAEMPGTRNGILLPGKSAKKGTGLIPLYLNKGLPVLHLLNMKELLPAYGLPFDPSPVPSAGEGGVYTDWQYHVPLAYVLLIINLLLLLWAAKHFPHRKIPL